MCATSAKIDVMVLAGTRLKHLLKPVGISIILESVNAITKIAVSTRQRGSRILGSLT